MADSSPMGWKQQRCCCHDAVMDWNRNDWIEINICMNYVNATLNLLHLCSGPKPFAELRHQTIISKTTLASHWQDRSSWGSQLHRQWVEHSQPALGPHRFHLAQASFPWDMMCIGPGVSPKHLLRTVFETSRHVSFEVVFALSSHTAFFSHVCTHTGDISQSHQCS